MSQIFTHFLPYYYYFILIFYVFSICFQLILVDDTHKAEADYSSWSVSSWFCSEKSDSSCGLVSLPPPSVLHRPASGPRLPCQFHWLVFYQYRTMWMSLPFRNDIFWIFTNPALMKHSSFKPFYYSCSIPPNKCLRIIFPNIVDSQTMWGLGLPPQCSQNPSVTLQSALCIQVLHLWLQPNVDYVQIY